MSPRQPGSTLLNSSFLSFLQLGKSAHIVCTTCDNYVDTTNSLTSHLVPHLHTFVKGIK